MLAPAKATLRSVCRGGWTPAAVPPVLLGLAGAAVLTLAAPRLVGGSVRWWFHPRLAGAGELAFYGGIGALVVSWLWLGECIRRGRASGREIRVAAALWLVPLLAGPPLFSHDLYSYLAQGTIARLGLSPYRHAPIVLAHLGHPRVLSAVDPFWRHTTAPYGPLFLGLVSAITSVTGSHLVAGALLTRLIELAGMCLLAVSIPRLADRFGADPARAQWLVLANPLLLLQLLAPGHNDLLMVGLMAGGILLALRDRPLLGIAICAVAATVKVPALVAVAFLAMAWARSAPGARSVLGRLLAAGAVLLAVAGAITVLTGLGLGWLSSGVFSTPNRVHLAITPSTAVGWTVAALLRDVGAVVSARGLESALAVATLAVVAVLAIAQLGRARMAELPWRLGLVLVAFAFGGPAAWPWYLSWGLVLLAASPSPGMLIPIVLFSLVGTLVVKPDGILILPLAAAPAVLALYAAAVAVGWWRWRPRRSASTVVVPEVRGGAAAQELAQIR